MVLMLPFQEIRRLVGTELGVSHWVNIDQERINRFAEATDDFKSVHIDLAAAEAADLETTIAHGMLTMNLLTHMASSIVPVPLEMTGGYYSGSTRFDCCSRFCRDRSCAGASPSLNISNASPANGCEWSKQR